MRKTSFGMEFLKLLINIGLILVTSTVFCTDDNLEISYRLPNNIVPVHYTINLTPYLEDGNFTFYGESNISIEIRHSSTKISLHSRELKINETATMLFKDESIIYKPMEHIYNDETNILTLNFDDALSPGLYTLNMKFAGNLLEVGYLKTGFMKIPYSNKEGNSTWLAATYFEPNGARQMFPCWDEPALKATFDISVMHHQKYEVLSNMPIREQFTEQDGMVRTHFNTTPMMSTYLVAIIVMSDFVRVPNVNETINIWSTSSLTSQTKFAHSIAEKVMPLLIQYTNSTKKIPKVDQVLIQNYSTEGMENWGLIIYDESSAIYDDSTHPTYKRIKIASLVTHELAHQWFGNLVTPSWWSYLWLSEGFASFFQIYILNKIFEEWRLMDVLVIQTLHDCLTIDIGLMDSVTLKLSNTLENESLFSFEVYKKAPVLLRMLHSTITDEIFRKGLVIYLATHQFSSVTPDDLWSAMQNALDESNVPHEDYRIKEVMDTWMNQSRYPVVNVEKNYETGEITISQKCFRAQETDESINIAWWIPITFATQSNPNFSNTVPSVWLRPNQNISFEINPSDWIIVNLQQTGYYRVNYDKTNWQKIARYLNSEEYTKIHVLNRAQIIIDAFAFLREDQISGFVFLNITNYLSRETDYVPWFTMFRILKWLSKSFLLPESTNIKIRMVKLFDGLLQNVGYEENSDDDDITKLKRLDAIKWACILGHAGCKEIATVKLKEHLADPDTHKIPRWWQEWTYCAGLMVANKTTWDKILELYQQNSDITILKSLSCAEDPDIIINYLNITALDTLLFHDVEHYFAFSFILQKHARNNLILDYIFKNFEIIKPRLVPTTTIIKLILSNVYSNDQIDKVKEFSEININQDPNSLFVIQKLIKTRKDHVKQSLDAFRKRFELSNLS